MTLTEKLQQANAGSRELDQDIHDHVYFGRDTGEIRAFAKPYTTSIDAAMTLVPDGADWAFNFAADVHSFDFEIWVGVDSVTSDAPTAPLAICIAALRAKKAQS